MKKYTVGQLKEILNKYDDNTLVSIEDMHGTAFYTDDISEQLDKDNPQIEIIIPVYITEMSIEPEYENNVFYDKSVTKILD